MYKLTLEPTSALVMKWAMKLYTNNEIVLQFINQLDLSSGDDLIAKCDAVCSWYDEIILNRKYFIKQLIERQLASSESEYQLVLLAAGKTPLAIEVLKNNYSKVHLIFEIDISGMDEKKRIYDKVCPNFSNKLKCITADISTNILTVLDKLNIGYRNDISTIILLEGISYYLPKIKMEKIIASFQSEKKKNIIIIEYMVPCKYVVRRRRYIPKEIFRIIKEHTGIEEISCYTEDELEDYLRKEATGDLIERYSMVEMEFARTGTNKYFKKSNDGWKEIVIGKI